MNDISVDSLNVGDSLYFGCRHLHHPDEEVNKTDDDGYVWVRLPKPEIRRTVFRYVVTATAKVSYEGDWSERNDAPTPLALLALKERLLDENQDHAGSVMDVSLFANYSNDDWFLTYEEALTKAETPRDWENKEPE